ncbi:MULTISPECIES: hypothetical protein [unclassified Brachybacterium]|uniref:hypothetical protein n=1 Tax=unclassified Brachybacterium TaxID=2623841 RepID=UPI004034B578
MMYQTSYAYAPPPRRRRGVKRLVFGILGILANGVGLFVMPFVAAFIALMISGIGSMELTALDPGSDSFEASAWSSYTLAVPADDLDSVSCTINGTDVDVEAGDRTYSPGTVDGVAYYEVHEIMVSSTQDVTVNCEGTDAVALSELGFTSTVVSFGVGIVLPIILGLVALVMAIWGLIALVASSSR